MRSLFGKLFLVASALLLVASYSSPVAAYVDPDVPVDVDANDPGYYNPLGIDSDFGSYDEQEREWRNHAQRFAAEFRARNYQNVRALLGCADAAKLGLGALGLSREEQERLYQEAREQALPDLREAWKTLQGDAPDYWVASRLRSDLQLYRLTPADIGATAETIDQVIRKALVQEALQELESYEQGKGTLSSFCITVSVYSLSPQELGLAPTRFKELLHVDAVDKAKRTLRSLRRKDLGWFGFRDLLPLIAEGDVTLEEIGSSDQEWQELLHGYQEEHSLTREDWETLSHRLAVESAQEALRRCKIDDSQSELARLEQLFDHGVTLEEVGLTQKKLDALRQYIRAVNE